MKGNIEPQDGLIPSAFTYKANQNRQHHDAMNGQSFAIAHDSYAKTVLTESQVPNYGGTEGDTLNRRNQQLEPNTFRYPGVKASGR